MDGDNGQGLGKGHGAAAFLVATQPAGELVLLKAKRLPTHFSEDLQVPANAASVLVCVYTRFRLHE